MSKNNMDNEMLRSQINDIIEGEIQNGINDYLEAKEGWEQNPDLVPAGSRVFGKIELTQEDVKEINND